ncbi:MAG: hypothetical protein HY291_14745 [Planctomycetes bacterium]|nr:hypothetical protein [Planctomycetota bacterium]
MKLYEEIRTIIAIGKHAPIEMRQREIQGFIERMNFHHLLVTLTVMNAGREPQRPFIEQHQRLSQKPMEKEALLKLLRLEGCIVLYLLKGLSMAEAEGIDLESLYCVPVSQG